MQTFLFYTSKVLRPVFASPYFLFLLFIFIAFVLLPVQNWKKRAVKLTGIALVFGLAAFSAPAVSRSLAYAWETLPGDSNVIGVTGPYDAVVVLGGTVDTATSRGEHIMLGDSAERLTGAVRLFKSGIAPRILVSGGSGYLNQKVKEAPLMAELLETMGVPREALILESESRNTYENALYVKNALAEAGLKRIVLVTSSWHMRRAAAIFKKAGIDFTPYAVDTLMEYYGIPGDYLPEPNALANSTRIIHEQIGYVAYKLLGRL